MEKNVAKFWPNAFFLYKQKVIVYQACLYLVVDYTTLATKKQINLFSRLYVFKMDLKK